jgi:hypothetical protein
MLLFLKEKQYFNFFGLQKKHFYGLIIHQSIHKICKAVCSTQSSQGV